LSNNIKIGIIIPAYQPNECLLRIICELENLFVDFEYKVLVVNDGSSNPECNDIFNSVLKRKHTDLKNHSRNLGKGGAIKTGLVYFKDKNYDYVITADADGQHSPDDILKICLKVLTEKTFIIGQRVFKKDNPLRSKFGNSITSYFFKKVFGNSIKDTQSGLRAFPICFADDFIAIKTNGYDFEFEMLVKVSKDKNIKTIPIKTIYLNNNESSHFRPLVDSGKIYLVFIKYSFIVPLIALADVLIFLTMNFFIPPASAFLITRVLTFSIYFLAMKKIIFKMKNNTYFHFSATFILFIFNLIIVSTILKLFTNSTENIIFLVYLFCSFFMFFFNFIIQRFIIYKK
jgi:glycosyltransferase involved in cell wall biosynthesis